MTRKEREYVTRNIRAAEEAETRMEKGIYLGNVIACGLWAEEAEGYDHEREELRKRVLGIISALIDEEKQETKRLKALSGRISA